MEVPPSARLAFSDISKQDASSFPKWLGSAPIMDRIRRLDAFLSYSRQSLGESILDMITQPRFNEIGSYLKQLHNEGFLGRHGATVAPHLFRLRFPTTQLTYTWIPKNSCTSMKRLLLEFEPEPMRESIRLHAFHETTQEAFGLSQDQYINQPSLKNIALIRNPESRAVSCYVDKFALPARGGRNFEKFILGHIREAQKVLEINRDVSESITFNEFLHYVLRTQPFLHDAHWMPQAAFLPAQHESFLLLPSNRLDIVVRSLGLSSATNIPRENTSLLEDNEDPDVLDPAIDDAAYKLPSKLSTRELASHSCFLDPETVSLLQSLYSSDYHLWQLAVAKSALHIN
jgi:hypothetical protein